MQKQTISKQQRKQSLWSFLRKQLLCGSAYCVTGKQVKELRRARLLWPALLITGIAVLFFVVDPAMAADDTKSITAIVMNFAIAILAKVIIWLAELMGLILLFLVDLLINIVQYNNFVEATPVQIGWPLIRDTINMFFIVLVLVSAFATIIGYPKDYNYREVLPKLLIMAVLINFSKTLIGLLIDFSQVVLLTFVNGFKQAAGGNFVTALGIGKIMRLTDTTGEVIKEEGGEITISLAGSSGANPWSMFGILISAIFATWILSIAITLILIMLIFFLGRIIMLWFLLITSPIAFFAWSLPNNLKNSLSAFTDGWWDKLKTALIGGPTMAFFLWLSLAMAQRNADLIGANGLYNPDNASTEVTQFQQTTQQNGNVAPSEFGDPQVFATFIIMVAFMLLGVKVSVDFSSKVVPPAQGIVGKLGASKAGVGVAAGLAAGALAGRGARRTAGAGGRLALGGTKLAGKGALAGLKEVEARKGWGAGAAKKLQNSGLMHLAPIAIQKKVNAVRGAQKTAAKEKAGVLQEITTGMTPTERLDYLKNEQQRLQNSKIPARKGDIQGVNLALAQQATNSLTTQSLNKENKVKARAELGEGATDTDIETRAKQMTQEQMSGILKNARDTALEQGDEDTAKKIKEMIEKNPALAGGASDMKTQAEKDASDQESERRVKPEAYMHAAYALPFAKAKGWINDEGKVTAKGRRDEEYKKFMRGKQGQYMKAHLEYADTDEGRAHVKSILTGKDAAGKELDEKQLNNQNYTINVSKDGEAYHVVQRPPEGSDQPATVRATNRFDKTTDKPEQVLSKVQDVNVKNQITNNLPAMGTGAENAGAIGTALPPKVAKELGEDLEDLSELNGGGRSGGVNLGAVMEERAEMGAKYARHGVSSEFLFGHDKKTGNFANDQGKEVFDKTVTDLVDKIKKDDDYSEETLGALGALSKQVGNQGEAYRIMQEKLSGLNQEQMYHAMTTGDPKNKENVQLMFANIVDEGKKQRDAGETDTSAMRFMNEAFSQPDVSGLTSSEKKERYEIKRRTQNLLFDGKE